MDPEKDDSEQKTREGADAPAPADPEAPKAAPNAGAPAASEAAAEDQSGPDHPKKDHPKDHSKDHRKGELKKRDHEIKELKREIQELKDKYLRLAAEMDNQRKRLDREKSDHFQFALTEVLREMLGVYDNFERALRSPEPTENPALLEGIGLIAKQYLDLLRKRGVVEIEAAGKPFDPSVHQAVMTGESADVAEPVVGEVFQKGYLLNDRLLRPALVKVIVPAQS
jgi:molecular chaperone GrpE